MSEDHREYYCKKCLSTFQYNEENNIKWKIGILQCPFCYTGGEHIGLQVTPIKGGLENNLILN